MKKVIALVMVLIVAMALVYAGASSEKAETKKVYNVGICQLVQHVALDSASQGFMDAITAEMGDAVTFDNR